MSNYDGTWTIEHHRDELIDRLEQAQERIIDLEAEVARLRRTIQTERWSPRDIEDRD